jgi:hypothetical protein
MKRSTSHELELRVVLLKRAIERGSSARRRHPHSHRMIIRRLRVQLIVSQRSSVSMDLKKVFGRTIAQRHITARMCIAAPVGRLGLRGAAARRSATSAPRLGQPRGRVTYAPPLYAIAPIYNLMHNTMLCAQCLKLKSLRGAVRAAQLKHSNVHQADSTARFAVASRAVPMALHFMLPKPILVSPWD